MIRIESLSARFGDFWLRDITLDIEPSSSLAVLGPSGAGKTLLIEAVLGLRRVESGRVLVDGRDVTGLPPEQRGVSYLPQDVALFPHLSVRKNILFGAGKRRLDHDVQEELTRLARLLDIEPLLDRRDVQSLSGGEAQRVALARAVLARPRIVFLDECFSSLDMPLRRQLREDFRQLRESLGLSVFMVTHDQEEAFLLGDKVAVIMDGRLMQVDRPHRLYARPANTAIARFLGISNILRIDRLETNGSKAICHIGSLRLAALLPEDGPDQISHVGFSDANIQLVPDRKSPAAGGMNVFRAAVRSAANLGHRWHVSLQHLGDHGVMLTCSVPNVGEDTNLLRQDRTVTVLLTHSAVRLLREA